MNTPGAIIQRTINYGENPDVTTDIIAALNNAGWSIVRTEDHLSRQNAIQEIADIAENWDASGLTGADDLKYAIDVIDRLK